MPRDILHRHLAARVRELAGKRGMSLNRLSDFAGISRSHLARILNGESSPSLATLAKLAEALGVGARDLLPPTG